MTQLRHVRSARWSAKMPVKHQQQPMTFIVSQFMPFSMNITQLKWDSRFGNKILGHN
jgi:hypothetical protein